MFLPVSIFVIITIFFYRFFFNCLISDFILFYFNTLKENEVNGNKRNNNSMFKIVILNFWKFIFKI